MDSVAAWVGPAATMIAAVMTAANFGARVTGWGFVVFTIGSIAWVIIGVASSQSNLVLTNVFLTAVNAIGIWRWLGRQARYEAIGAEAEQVGRAPAEVSVFAATGIAGRDIVDNGGTVIAEAVEAIVDCQTGTIAHVVARFGGIGGVAETVVAIPSDQLTFCERNITANLPVDDLRRLPPIEQGQWRRLLDRDNAGDRSGRFVPQAS